MKDLKLLQYHFLFLILLTCELDNFTFERFEVTFVPFFLFLILLTNCDFISELDNFTFKVLYWVISY